MQLSRCLWFAVSVSALKYINHRKIESLGLGSPDESTKWGSSQSAHLILVKTQTCGEICEMFERSLDGMAEQVATTVSEEIGKNLTFFKTEISKTGSEEFKQKFGLLRLPTTILLRGPWIYDYNEDLVSSKVIGFVKSHVTDVMTRFETEADAMQWLEDAKSHPGAVRILIETGEAGAENFELVAGGEREFALYGHLNAGKADNAKGRMRVQKWHYSYTIEDVDFGEHKKIYDLILREQLPLLGMIDMTRMRYYFLVHKSFAWFVHSDSEAFNSLAEKELASIITAYKDRFHFVHVNPVHAPHYKDFVKEVLRLNDTISEALVITDLNGPGRFSYVAKNGWTKSSLKKWFEDVLSGSATRELQSERVPKTAAERMTSMGIPKMVADEFIPTFLPSPKETYVILIPSLLCEEEVCEQALKTAQKYYSQHQDSKIFGSCGKVNVRFIDGHKNEFDPKWNFDLTSSPPAWLVMKETGSYASIAVVPKKAVPSAAFEDVGAMELWLETTCRGSQQVNDEL